MKYNNDILNKIISTTSEKIDNKTHLDNIMNGYLEMMKKGSKIHIKKANRGKFTASAKRAGQSVQEHARSVLADPNATPLQKRRANFAQNAAKWHK